MAASSTPSAIFEPCHRRWFANYFRDGQIRRYHACAPALGGINKIEQACNTRSTTITRAIEVTTAAVVERPTSSAPAPVEKPSLHPTAVMTSANSALLMSPV